MKKMRMTVTLAIVSAASLVTGGTALAQERNNSARGHRPNIVLLLTDDLGYGDVGCYGSATIPTPHIDALARSGVRFTDAYVTAGTCSPSRAALVTGRYQQRFGFEFNTGPRAITESQGRGLDPAARTFADVFQKAGYSTGVVGKWHLGSRDKFHPLNRGFDEFFGFLPGAHTYVKRPRRPTATERKLEGGGGSSGRIFRGKQRVDETEYLTDAFAREAISFIRRHKDDPFFLYVPFNAVHTPIQATQKYKQRFARVSNRKQRTYNAMVSALDDAIGAIMKALRTEQLDQNTLVIFLNDNGGTIYTRVQSNGPLRLGKLFLFEGGVRVPMIVRWPGVTKDNGVHRDVVSTLDIFPTVCAAAGITPPKELALDGVDLLPYLKGEKHGPTHRYLFWRNGPNKAVRGGHWKLVKAGDHRWLFNLSEDIGEAKNLAAEEPGIVKDFEEALRDWESRLKPPAWPSRPGRSIEVDGVPYEIHI